MDFQSDGLASRILKARMDFSGRQGRVVPQSECAQLCGFTAPAWSAYETGRNEPTLKTIEIAADKLGVRFAWLACNDGPMHAVESYPDVPDRYTTHKAVAPNGNGSGAGIAPRRKRTGRA